MLPADDVSYGFDNIAGVQRMSPTLMERYLAAAQKISSVAVGASARAAPPTRSWCRRSCGRMTARGACRLARAAARSCATRFPRDGVYSVRVQLTRYAGRELRRDSGIRPAAAARAERRRRSGARVRVAAGSAHRRPRIRRRPIAAALDADWQVRFPAKAGPRDVALTFLNRTPALLENLLEPFEKPVPGGPNGYYTTQKGAYLRSVEISGPHEASGAGNTPSRQRIFVCRPSKAADETACAEEDPLDACASRVPAARRGRGSPDAARVL